MLYGWIVLIIFMILSFSIAFGMINVASYPNITFIALLGFILSIMVAFGLITRYMAINRGRNPKTGFLVGFFFHFFGVLCYYAFGNSQDDNKKPTL